MSRTAAESEGDAPTKPGSDPALAFDPGVSTGAVLETDACVDPGPGADPGETTHGPGPRVAPDRAAGSRPDGR